MANLTPRLRKELAQLTAMNWHRLTPEQQARLRELRRISHKNGRPVVPNEVTPQDIENWLASYWAKRRQPRPAYRHEAPVGPPMPVETPEPGPLGTQKAKKRPGAVRTAKVQFGKKLS